MCHIRDNEKQINVEKCCYQRAMLPFLVTYYACTRQWVPRVVPKVRTSRNTLMHSDERGAYDIRNSKNDRLDTSNITKLSVCGTVQYFPPLVSFLWPALFVRIEFLSSQVDLKGMMTNMTQANHQSSLLFHFCRLSKVYASTNDIFFLWFSGRKISRYSQRGITNKKTAVKNENRSLVLQG